MVGPRIMTDTLRLAIPTLVVGLVIEASAGIQQLASYALSSWSWFALYYLGLATTVLGLSLMYRGKYRWSGFRQDHAVQSRTLPAASLAIFSGSVASIAILGEIEGRASTSSTPPEIQWCVGGLVAFAVGSFFLGLLVSVDPLVGRVGRVLARTGFCWSLGVAVLTGLLVGVQFNSLFVDFFTNPLGLITSSRQLAIVIAPLSVSYLLLAGAYVEAYRRLPRGFPWLTRRRGPIVRPY